MSFTGVREESSQALERKSGPITMLPFDTDDGVPPGLSQPSERETIPADEEPAVLGAEDPVRLYLKEIGKVSLLTADQEVEIGRRIEVGQIELRRALAGIPQAVRAILEVADQVRRQELLIDDLILLPEGTDPRPEELKGLFLALGRIRRLGREISRLETAVRDGRRSKRTRPIYHRWIRQNRAQIQSIVADLPLKPALVDELVSDLRKHMTRLPKLESEPEEGRRAGISQEL